MSAKKTTTYRDAGVDIEKAEQSLSEIKHLIAGTHNARVLKNIGSFGGFYELPIESYRKPVLISSTDGVGTKLLVAIMMDKHDTVGQDLVNHCINDIAVCGAQPLFFLDYFGCGSFRTAVFRQIIDGFVTACKAADLPLVGGETAEMPDLYKPDEYDLAGTIVGIVEKENIIDGQDIQMDDVLVGVASNGLHTNGYSLARKVLLAELQLHDHVPELGITLGNELLKIHLNYLPIIRDITAKFPIRGIAHITGGGLYKNIIRVLPEGLFPRIEWKSWKQPPIFRLIRELGNVPQEDMRQTFNLGIGLVFIVQKNLVGNLLCYSRKFEQDFHTIGQVTQHKT